MLAEVSKSANKKEAKRVVGRRKVKKSTQRKDFGNIKMPDRVGAYSTFLFLHVPLRAGCLQLVQDLPRRQRRPERQMEKMTQRLLTNAIK